MARTTRSSAARQGRTSTSTGAQQLSSPPPTPAPTKAARGPARAKSTRDSAAAVAPPRSPATPADNRKRSRKPIKQEEGGDVNELPHNLGTALPTPGADESPVDSNSPPQKRIKTSDNQDGESYGALRGNGVKREQLDDDDDDAAAAAETKPTPKKNKKENYGLTPGISPYPDYAHPTPEECKEVIRLLEKVHGKVEVPKAIPPPSLDVSGCGEVPSVLDALVRTRLSANTTNKNSSTAFQGLVKRFGVLTEGIGKGSVDWDAVRRAPQREVYKAIERGGLADRKSKDIQAILQLVYEENQERRAALADTAAASASSSSAAGPAGAEREPEREKREEIAKAEQHIISLDHLHLLSTEEAINKMLSYPGIGPKTASCVALFCLQRPSFAVDTHVFRLCQWLGWVPRAPRKGQPKVDRNSTYSHCDARIPDEYKRPLHQLLIKHGKTCPRCRAITGQASAGWDDGCPIEHLVKRHGAKKGGVSVADRKRAKQAAALEDGDGAEGDEVKAESGSELSDPPSDED